MVPTTQPEDIASYANRVGNAWKIGRKDVGDGVLLVVAKDDRKVRIEVAKTLEGAIPDLAARQIIDEAITPQLSQAATSPAGLHAAVDQLIARITGEALPAPKRRRADAARGQGFDWMDLAHLPVLRRADRRRRAARHPGPQARLAGHGRRRRRRGPAHHVQPGGGGDRRRSWRCCSRCCPAAAASARAGAAAGAAGPVSAAGAVAAAAAAAGAAAAAAAGAAPAAAAISAAAAPRGTGDGAGKELATHPRPHAAAPLAGRIRHAPGDPARPAGAADAPRGRQREAPQRRDPHLRRGRPAHELPAARRHAARTRAWPCSASCASGTPSTTTAC